MKRMYLTPQAESLPLQITAGVLRPEGVTSVPERQMFNIPPVMHYD